MNRLIENVIQTPGAISTGTNGTAIPARKNAVVANQVSCQISFTGSSESGASAQLQKSNDGTSWANDGSTVSISGASGTIWVVKANVNDIALFWRVVYAVGSGSITPTENWVLVAEEN